MTVNVTNTSGSSTYLNVWIDYNRNGSIADAGDQVLINSLVANGTSNSNRAVIFTVPLTATAGVAGVRVRLTSVSGPGPDGAQGNGEVEDYVVNIVTNTDFGDAPAFTSASQRADGALIRIGSAATDTEAKNPAIGTATADDTTGNDDEDLTLPAFTVGTNTTLAVPITATTASLSGTTARAIVFVDWNGDNDVADTNETLAVQTIATGTNTLNFSLTPPTGTVPGTKYLRIRVAETTATPAFSGASTLRGEVEDYAVTVLPNTDFGDYPSFASATQVANGLLRIGSAATDAEAENPATGAATADDTTGTDDEDLTLPAFTVGTATTLAVPITATTASLSGTTARAIVFVDWNGDNDVADTNETLAVQTIAAGTNTLNFSLTPPIGTVPGTKYLRIRVAETTATPAFSGASTLRGEVEDDAIMVVSDDFGDFASFGSASSSLLATLKIGATKDAELSATPDATATGDDTTGSDDEDGVTIPATLSQGSASSMTVNVSNTTGSSAFLNVWIDFNANGVLTDSGEQVATNTLIATGTSAASRAVNFTVPATAILGNAGVRVRLTSTSSPGATGAIGNGEVEDYLATISGPITDFGDFASFTSASSTVVANLKIGATTDREASAMTDATATGDNLDGTDDEDGVSVPVNIAQGAAASVVVNVTNTSGAVAYLNAWIDFNRDGVLTDAGEQIAVNTSIATGTSNANQTINFTAPVAANVGIAGVRVRLTSVITPTSVGLVSNGEVEDYVTQIIVPTTDFGDELDFADASSTANSHLRLGALVDVEGSSTKNATATGDDITGSDDEDGLSFPSVTAGQPVTLPVTVTNNSGAAAFFNAWIDFNNNGSLLDAGEQVATNVSVADGLTDSLLNLNFNVPTNAVTAATSLGTRFRLTNTASPAPTGFAGIGEVEDHPIVILAPLTDFGDHSDYADVSNTASTNLRLGLFVDTEYASTRNVTATGDDVTGNDDEDGVTIPTMTAGAPATVPVTVTNNTGAAAFLNAWIDYNDNGIFGDPGEQIATNTSVANLSTNVVSNIAITVPATATTATPLGVRVRITALNNPGATGAGGLGEVEDYVVTIAVPTTDFGDFTSFGSASSTAVATMKLGALLDTEFVQTVNATATGDDITASDDEDSVIFPSMIPGAPATIPVLVTNTSGVAAFLNAWIDYNNNGTLEAGEQIATNVSIATGSSNITQNLSITVPVGALTGVNLGARFRLTSTSGAAATGLVGNGEVEDFILTITAPTTDFGDDLDFADASQGANPFLRLGALIDTEFVSTRNATATGDDTTGSDDEDGVVVPAMIAGQTVTIPVTISNGTGADGFLNAWIDYNNNGVLTDSGEQVATNVLSTTGTVNAVTNLSVTVPATATTGVSLGLRFRLSAPSGLGPTGINGLAGEVEDYAVTIATPSTDFGDHASLADASSTRVATIKLGPLTDTEFLSTRNATATGDDTIGVDDEDAVTLPTMTAGAPATIPVLVTNTSGVAVNLNAWIDYNNNGSLADVGEQIASNVSIANGSNNLTQNIITTVPATATTGVNLPVRVRLTSTTTPGPTGASGNGEVEDYIVNIANPTTDFGDFASFGSASNAANATLRLGALIDAEFVATTNANATGDDITASDDEDGVTLPTIIAGQTVTVPVVVTNTTGAGAFLNAWIDFNNDGDVLDVGEQVITNAVVANGSSNTTITPSVTAPANALIGVSVGVRFRLTTTASPAATGVMGTFGEVEDYKITIAVPTTDLGDFTSFADATSTVVGTIKLGVLTDVEFLSTRNATATGDDTTGSDDEDAVTFPSLMAGAPATIPVLVSNFSGAAVHLNAWIDYNNNGVLTDAGEQIANNVSIPNGSNNLRQNIVITVPASALAVTHLGARFRLTSTATPGATGVSGNGEVEDYVVSIANPPLDYGDSSVLGSASSTVVATLFLGTAVTDTEFVPTFNATASGDDNTATDDEDGVSIPTLTAGAPGTITVTATNTTGVAAFLNAWIDFNNDGDVLDAGEQLATNTNVATGTSNRRFPLNFTVPATAVTGANLVLRFRLTSTSTPGITGTSGNGEVEDHVTTIAVPITDFGDWNGAPDASSVASSNLRMGSLADTEFAATRNATATGDDITGSDDEDGVTLAASYNLSAASSATVVTTNLSGAAAYLNAWIDFNNNGSFADAGEQIATNMLVDNGTNGVAQTIHFTVPAATIPGQRGMRVRFTDVQNPTSFGAAGIGEVEDNIITINCPGITLSPTVPNGTLGAAYSQTITSAGGTGPYSYAVSAGALPSGFTLSPAGLLSGTLVSASVANFTLRATDANGCIGIQSYTHTPICPSISITPTTGTSGLINTAYTQTLTASGGTAPYTAWTVTAGTLPTGLTLNAATGLISGTPTVAATPAASITVRVNGNYGCQGTQVISLKICPVVTLNPTSLAAATVGAAYSQTISGSGGTAPYTFSLSSGSLPTWASLNSSTGVISGTPNSATTANFIIRATDANGCSGTRAYSLTPVCPVITIAPASLPVPLIHNVYSQAMTPSVGSAPFVFTIASGALPTGLTLDSSTGVISGTPTTSATATFTIRATDFYGCIATSASYSLTPAPSIDFGDLSTLASASSTRDTTLKMGALVDYEYSQASNATATGDDTTGSDDEDGVTLPTGLIQGQTGLSATVNVTNTSGAETYLNGWIDFNNNGVLTDAGEQIVFNEPIVNGTSAANMTYTFNVPSVAAVATVGVRFRLTSIPNPGSTGASGAGEVEDDRIGIAEPEDHGDFTLFQDASSKLSSTLMMGDFTDAEFTAFTNLAATGDDLNNVSDEDGVTVPAILVRGQAGALVTVNLTNLSGALAYLNGYADFNNNGALTDTGEQIVTNIVVPTGTASDYQTFFFDVPVAANLGNIGMRFRLTSVSNPGPGGLDGNGEVEDYTSTIVAPSSNFRDYFYTIRRDSSNNYYLDEISVYNPTSTTPAVSVVQNILNLSAATPGFNASASNAFMNGLALDWLNRRFYWNSTSGDTSKYNFQLNTAYYDNVTKTWSSQAVTGSTLTNIPLNTGTPNSSGAGAGAFPRAAYYAGDYYTGGQRNDNMVAWRLNSAGTGLKTPAFNDYPNFFHLTQTFGGGDFVIRPHDGFLVTSTAVNDNTTTLFTQFMSVGFNPSGAPAASVVIDGKIPASAAGGVQIAGVGGVTRMYAVGSVNARVYRLDNYDTNAPVAVSVGNLPPSPMYPDLSEGISSSVTSLGVKGIVYEDTNGLMNGTVDGIGSNAGGTLFAMLVDSAGNLVDSFPVKEDGTFILGGAAANTSYTVVLSTSFGSLGGAAPVPDLPTGWMNTGEFLGTGVGSDGTVNGRLAVSIVNNGIVNAKFGISQTVSVGNLVWNDANNNGLKDSIESGISGVTAQLWTPGSDNAIGGTGSAADTLVATTTTTGSGIYGFTHQVQGKYFICVIPPTFYSFASSTVVTTDNGVDNDNNGAQPGGRATQVYSPVFDLAVGKEPGNLVSGGIDIDNTIDFGLLTALDFGDYSLFGSASSALVSNLFVGTLIDAEYAATTDITATGDNRTGLNDEDGAMIPVTGVVQGAAGSMTVRVTNTSGSSAFMNVWIDFNNNGVLTDAGEQVAVNTLIANATSNATRTVNFTAPATASIGNVGVRVRLTSTNSPGSVGSSGKGEVEDHLIEIVSPIDYGDFASFASAGSTMVKTLFMGTLVDTELSSTTNAEATADDLNGSDDEDGVTVPATMTQGAPGTITVNVTNTSGGNARLSAWIDFNRNGVLTDAGEQVANDLVIHKNTIDANKVIHFIVPVNASIGTAGLRVRLTDQNNAASVGLVGSGEVEDHITSIGLPATDFGDWNGAADASSLFSANLRIGTLTDNEFVSTLNATATGDDITGSDDEDGVTLAASYIPAIAGTATVVVTNSSGAAAYLNAWIDYNNNGSFADVGEQIATDMLVATGTHGASQTLSFTPPLNAIPGQRGARFRLTSVTNPPPVGAAGSGEVEDVMVTINCPDITVNPTTLTAPVVGFAYTQTVTATGTLLAWSATNLPAWLSLNTATGALTGTATTTTPVTFTLTATDVNGCAGSRVHTLTPACPVITLGGVPPPNSYLSTSYTHTLTASGGTAPYSFSLISGTLPPGITLASNGTVSGMPTSLGSYAVTLQVTDAYNCQSATTSVTFVAKRMAIGNQVWIDMNDDGLRNSTESGVPNLPLQLWSPGINGNAENGSGDDVMLATTLTDTNGLYLFTHLPPGDYYVRIPTPPTYYPKVSTSQVALDNRVNNDNNGLQTVLGDPVVTPLITLSPGTEPSNGADGDDTDADSTVDIGFANPSPCLVTNLIDNPSFEFQGLPNTTGTPVSVLGYNGAGTALGTNINAYQWLGGTNGTSGVGEPVQRAQILAGNNGTRVSWTESVKSRHGKRMLLMQGTNSCLSLRPAGGGTWSSVLQAGKEYELSVWAANASSGAASILWDLGANAHVFQIITGSTPGIYQYYTVPQGELSATAPGVDQCCGFTGGTISYAAFGAADYNGWTEATANHSQPVWRQFTYRFRIANAATQTQIDSASIVLSGGSSTHPVVTDLVYLCQVGTSATLTLGNQVWNDANKNGVRDTGAFSELGVGGVTVELFRSPNDTAGDADDLLVGSTTTSPVGSYNFTGLAEGKYVVRVTPPSGIPAAGGNVVTADNGINNENNGSQPGGPGTYLYSPVITLAVGAEPVNDGDTNPDTELSVDFGLFTGIQLGNQLFIESNNDGVYASGSESGVGAGVVVELLDGTVDTVIASTTTNSSGVYGFSVYQPGAYRVRIPTPPVAYPLASGVADLSDNGEDNDSNGSQPGGLGTAVISPTIMLTAAREPGSSGSSNTENTLDFGFRGCPTITISPGTVGLATQYVAYNPLSLSSSGGSGDYSYQISSGGLPSGVSLSSGGVISGTPVAAAAPGSYNFTVRSTDSQGCSGTQSYTMAVDYPPISILPPMLPDTTRLVPYFQQITASGGTAPYSYSRLTGNLPAGITISPTGVISGTTTAAPGNYSFTVQALDANGAPGTQPYSITVRCSDFVITPSALASATVGSAYSAPLNAVGGSAPYLWSVVSGSLPPGLSLSSSGLISGTPTQAMTASFTVEARDAFDCAATRLYTLVVNCPSLGITPATLSSAYYGSAYSQQLAASGGTGPYTWSVIAGTPPAGITLSSSGLLSGTSTVYGTASFTVRATDAYNCSTTQSYALLVKGLSLGDVVYEDTNFNGLRDNGEPGLKDVTVELWDTGADNATGGSGPSSDLLLRSTVTGALGQYHFDNLQPGSFFLRLLMPSELNIPGGNPVNLDNGIDNDNNSASQPGGPGTPVFSPVIALTQGGEPTVDDGNPDTDHTLDFGLFRGMSVGNLVWQDTNDNGLRDPGEPGLGGIALELWTAGADNRIGGTDDVRLRTTTSASDGSYLFNALAPLKLYVRLPTPPAVQPLSSSITVTADNGIDHDDNGHQINGGATYSQVITLSPADEPGTGGGTYDETTIDFGFCNVTPSIYVSATQADSIQTFDASTGLYTGSLVGAFGSSQSQGNAEWGDVPYAIEFGPDGNWYVAHYGASNLRKISPAGVDLGTVLDNSTAGVSLIAQFTLGPDGAFYVVDASGGRVVRFQGPGGVTLGAPIGSAPYTFITQNGIEDINFGPDGNLYLVVQSGAVREVRRHNSTTGALLNTIVSGTQIVQMVPGGQPIALISGIDIHDNTLYGVNRSDGEIFSVDLTTPAAPGLPQLLATLSTAGMGDVDTRDVEFNPANGRLYISGYQWGKPVNAGSYISGSLISVDITGAPNGTVSIHEVPIPRPPGPNNEIWAGPRDLAIGRPFAPLPESVSIGSIVWNDLDADGIQDASEQGIASVRVELWRDADGSTANGAEFLVGWTFTDTHGHYYFSGQAPGVYQVRIPVSNFGEGLPLAGSGYSSPLTSILDDQIDGDDSGRQPDGPKTVVFSPLITLTPGTEPLGNGTSAAEHARGGELDNYTVDANGDMTIDFGFVEPGIMGIGNLVFVDANGNNRFDVGEGRDEATVALYRWGDIPGVTQPVATTVTSNGGLFLFSNLWQGQYFIHLPATQFESSGNLRGLFSLPGYSTGDDDTGEDSIDSDEPWVTGISSTLINLVREQAPTDDGIETGHESATDLDDFNINLTADMGLFRPVALGNLVFADNNSNGRFDSGEAITGVRVELYTDTLFPGVDHPLAFTTTDSQGRYGFSLLRPGNYIVHVPASEFVSGKPLFQRISILEGLVGDDDVGEDGVNNGDPAVNGVSTLVISLFPGNAPTDDSGETGFKHPSDNQIDAAVDLTIDFGFQTLVGVGNLVYIDSNVNGFADLGEGVDGVTVELYRADQTPGFGLPIFSRVTSGGGHYFFDSLPAGDYRLHIPPSEFEPGRPLYMLESTPGASSVTATLDDNVEDNENGLDDPTPFLNGISTAVFTLAVDEEPTATSGEVGLGAFEDDERDDNNFNLTLDFGFSPSNPHSVGVGNLVFVDLNGNGIYDEGEGIDGVKVQLFGSGAGPLTAVPLASTITSGGGHYIFGNLAEEDYFVFIPPSEFAPGKSLSGWRSIPGDGSDNGIDDNLDENGIDSAAPTTTGIASVPFNLTPEAEPTNSLGEFGSNSFSDDVNDDNTDLTIDFGFFRSVSVGNLVFIDANYNGRADTGEGVGGVTIELYTENSFIPFDAPVATTVSAEDGSYLFSDLAPGRYFLRVPAWQFDFGMPLYFHASSLGVQSGDDHLGEDGIDNGNPSFNGINTAVFELSPTNAPVGSQEGGHLGSSDDIDDSATNLTLDLGFVPQVTIGNLIFSDANNDGIFDPNIEIGLDGVTVELCSNLSDATVPVATTSTYDGGLYSFNVAPGSYFVRVPAMNFAAGAALEGSLPSLPSAARLPTTTAGDDDTAQDGYTTGSVLTDGVSTPLFTLLPGSAPTFENTETGYLSETDDYADTDVDLTVDLGFSPKAIMVGNLVFRDVNANGIYDAGIDLPMPNVTVRLFQQAQTVTDTPVSEAVTSANGTYMLYATSPAAYYVHIPASMFAAGAPLSGLSSIPGLGNHSLSTNANTAKDDRYDENGTDSSAPQLTGVSSGIINLAYGAMPVNSSPTAATGENGHEAFMDDAADSSGIMTIDFGFAALLSAPLDQRITRDLSPAPAEESSETATFTSWQARNNLAGLNQPADDPDADGHTNLLEYALGTSPASGAQISRFRLAIHDTTGVIDAFITRPLGEHRDLRYILESSADLQTWAALSITPTTTTIGADQTETLRFADLEAATTLVQGFVRLKVQLDADLNGTAEATAVTPVQGWSRRTFNVGRETLSMPLLKPAVFIGRISSVNGTQLTLPVTLALPPESAHYLEVLDGTLAGQTFDLGSDLKLASGAAVAGARVAIRPHWTLNTLLPASAFHSGSTPEESDRALTFDSATNVFQTHPFADESIARRVLPPQEGLFVQIRSTAVTLAFLGEVRTSSLALPQSAGNRFIGTGLALPLTPGSQPHSVGSRLRLWSGDADPATAAYHNYLLNDQSRWIDESTGADITTQPALDAFRAHFLVK